MPTSSVRCFVPSAGGIDMDMLLDGLLVIAYTGVGFVLACLVMYLFDLLWPDEPPTSLP